MPPTIISRWGIHCRWFMKRMGVSLAHDAAVLSTNVKGPEIITMRVLWEYLPVINIARFKVLYIYTVPIQYCMVITESQQDIKQSLKQFKLLPFSVVSKLHSNY